MYNEFKRISEAYFKVLLPFMTYRLQTSQYRRININFSIKHQPEGMRKSRANLYWESQCPC
jgi:hypothetical protein